MRVRKKALWSAALAIWLLMSGAAANGQHRQGNMDGFLAGDQSRGPRKVFIGTKAGAKNSVTKRVQGHGDSVDGDHPTIDALAANL